MKLFVIFLLLLSLAGSSAAAVAESSSALPELPDRLPVEYKKTLKEHLHRYLQGFFLPCCL